MLNRIRAANDFQDENWIANLIWKLLRRNCIICIRSILHSTTLCSNISPSWDLVIYGQYFVFVKLTFYLWQSPDILWWMIHWLTYGTQDTQSPGHQPRHLHITSRLKLIYQEISPCWFACFVLKWAGPSLSLAWLSDNQPGTSAVWQILPEYQIFKIYGST